MAPRGVHPHMPPYSNASVFGGLACCGDCNRLPFVLRHLPYSPLIGGASPFNYTPTLSYWFPVHLYVSGISVCYVGISLLSGRVLGCFLPSVGGLGHQHLRYPYAHSCTFFVVHYVSHFYYSSDYYSSSYSGIFWPVFYVISDSGSFPDRISSQLGSAWCASTTTLDAKRLWRCSWLSFCATAATSIFNASFSLCQLCYGFSTGRFLFLELSLPSFVSYICLVGILVSAFYI